MTGDEVGPERVEGRGLFSSLHHLIEDHAQRTPERSALLAPGRRALSYGELRAQVNDAVLALRNLGVRRQDRVAVVVPNGPEMAAALLAVAARAICVPLDPRYGVEEWQCHLLALRIRALLAQGDFAPDARTAARAQGVPIIDLWPEPKAAAGVFTLAGEPWRDPVEESTACGGDDAFLLPTSGTTARPKAVPLTHANVCHSIFNTGTTLALGPADRLLGVLPLHHAHGLISGLLASLGAGAEIVCTSGFAPGAFLPWLAEFQPSWYTAVPAIHQAVLAETRAGRPPAERLRFIRSASAPLPARVLGELEAVFGVPVVETYGMTEAASQIASNPLPPGRCKPGSVGPAAGPEVAIMDHSGVRAAAGEVGEIVIRGANVTRGYDNPDPGAFIQGWLRTGDQGYLDGEGYLFLVGRTKEIINRGGEKITPREIEDAIGTHPEVAEVVVFACPHPRLGEDVAAAVVLRLGARTSVAELRRYAAARLALFKVPRRIALIDQIPRGPTGKVQRTGLAHRLGMGAPAATAARRRPGLTAPRSARERELARIWSEVLGIDRLAADADFFALGGESLAAAQIMARIEERLGVALSFDDFFAAPTISLQARHIGQAGPAGDRDPPRLPTPSCDHCPVPLSYPQLGLYVLERLGLGQAHHVLSAWHIRGRLDEGALERSLAAIVARHEILRTTFTVRDGAPVQVVRGALAPPLDRLDLGADATTDRHAAIVAQARALVQEVFDLEAGSLLKVRLLRFAAADHALIVVIHHLIIDGWSMRLLWDELAAHYEVLAAGRSNALTPPALHYRQFVCWQRDWVASPAAEVQRAFWRSQLRNLTTLPLLADHPPPAAGSPLGARQPVRLSRRLSRRLIACAREHGVTLFMTLLAGFLALLHRYTAHDDIALGTLVAGRHGTQLERLMGMCVNILVLRTDLSENPTFGALLDRVRRVTLDALRHQELPFTEVLRAVEAPRSRDRHPLFQVLFVLQGGGPNAGLSLPGLEVEEVRVDPGSARFDLTLEVAVAGGRIEGWLEYATALFEPATIARMAGHLATLLDAAAADPAQPLFALPLLGARERAHLQRYGRGSGRPRELPRAHLHRLFEHQAARTPAALAIRADGGCLSFAELNARANQLARHLRRQGAVAGQPLGLLVERDLALVVGVLAILKAGAAYVPLDPTWPRPRLRFMIENAGLDALVTVGSLAEGLAPPGTALVRLDADAPAIAREGQDNLEDDPPPEDVAYVLYTSGSSGRPKGVLGTHGGVLNALRWAWRTFPFAAGEVCAHRTSISFGDSIQELFGPLLQGVPLVVIGTEVVVDPARLIETLAAHRVSRIILVPALIRTLLERGSGLARELPDLRLWLSSGEALPADLARRFHEVLPGRRLINIYGASEVSDTVTWCEVAPADLDGRPPPIGRPIANTRVYLLDDHLAQVPLGVPGELCIAGAGLARGYLREPRLDAQRFVPNPFDRERWTRLYRTGDLARFRADGTLEYLGRKDGQVQIRGCRVEIAEVEAALCGHPGVRQAAVMARPGADGGTRLVAFLVARDDFAPSAHELHCHARATMPSYMVPSEYLLLDALPATPSGKVDRRALAETPAGRAVARVSPRAPGSPIEEVLVGIWQEILGIAAVGIEDSFFELGGHSLLAGQVLARVRQVFEVELPLRTLFEAPTIAALAARIEAARGLPRADVAGRIGPRPPEMPAPASLAQETMLRIEAGVPGLPFLTLPYTFRLRGRLNGVVLEQSLALVIQRHEALRTVFRQADRSWQQVVLPAAPIGLQADDFEPFPPAARLRMVALAARAQAWTPIDVRAEPPLRLRLLRLAEDDHVLLLTVHHIAIDGCSLGIIQDELSRLYAAQTSATPVDLPAPRLQHGDFAYWQRAWCASEAAAGQCAYWRARLAGIAPVFGADDDAAGRMMSWRTASIRLDLPGDLIERLAGLGRREGSTPFMILLAAFKTALLGETGSSDLCLATVLANRSRPETEGIVGLVETTALIRTRLHPEESFREALARVRDALLEAEAHQDLPLPSLAARLADACGLDLIGTVDVMVIFQNAVRQPLALAGLTVGPLDGFAGEGLPVLPFSRTRLSLILKEEAAGMAATCLYKEDQLDGARVERLLAGYRAILEQVAAAPETSLRDLADRTRRRLSPRP